MFVQSLKCWAMECCDSFYKVTLSGVVTVIHHHSTKITSTYSYIDGTLVDDSLLEELEPQIIPENLINEGLAYNETLNKVEWTKSPTSALPDRRIIVMRQGDMLVGEAPGGHQYNLIMLNRFGVIDIGASDNKTNITSSERPTVQLPGESGDEAHGIAFVDDVPAKDYMETMIGSIPFSSFGEAYVSQLLPSLEQSYIDDLGNPEKIDGEPYDSESNNYVIGDPYMVFMWFDESLVMHYVLFSKDYPGLGILLVSVMDSLNLMAKDIAKLSTGTN